jgi:hypothetical protein
VARRIKIALRMTRYAHLTDKDLGDVVHADQSWVNRVRNSVGQLMSKHKLNISDTTQTVVQPKRKKGKDGKRRVNAPQSSRGF